LTGAAALTTEREIAARILCCPDCLRAVGAELQCPACGRDFAPEADGIIDALPAAMKDVAKSKEEIQAAIDSAGPGEHGRRVVLYEKAFHDQQASYYDRLFADPLPVGEYYRHLVRDQIYSFVRGAEFVVDLCCGTGKSSMPLVERGIPVVGIDVSREMLRSYRRKAEAKGRPGLTLVHADASCPPLRAGSCGAITMIGGLHHIQDRAGSVEQCWKALGKAGLLIYHEPLKTGKRSRASRWLENVYALTDPARAWRALGRRLGFRGLVGKAGPGGTPPALDHAEEDFTPYERPFTAVEELLALVPPGAEVAALRSQGQLSFREFARPWQRPIGVPLAALVVRLDDRLSRRAGTGDALFAVFRKRG
jgi:SAM-dependent methyltransferase